MMTPLGSLGWAMSAAALGALQARALLAHVTTRAARPLVVLARIALVAAFALVVIRGSALAAFAGWLVGYPLLVLVSYWRLRRTA